MSEYFIIRLLNDDFFCNWIRIDKNGHATQEVKEGSLSDASKEASKFKIIILIPGTKVSLKKYKIPTKNKSNIQKMLPYLIEEDMAEDPEKLFFTYKLIKNKNEVLVATTSKDYLQKLIDRLKEENITPTHIYSDTQGVPDTPGHLTLIAEKNLTYGKIPGELPFVLENFNLIHIWEMLPDTFKSKDLVNNINLYTDHTGYDRCKVEINNLRDKTTSVNFLKFKNGLLPGLGANLIKKPGNSFLVRDFAPATNWLALFKPWILSSSLLLVIIITSFFLQLLEISKMENENNFLLNNIQDQCHSIFGSSDINTCKFMVDEQLNNTPTDLNNINTSLFLEIIEQIARSFNSDIVLESIVFREDTMDMRITTPDIATLDTFTSSIEGLIQLSVTIQSTNQTDNGIDGRLQIREVL